MFQVPSIFVFRLNTCPMLPVDKIYFSSNLSRMCEGPGLTFGRSSCCFLTVLIAVDVLIPRVFPISRKLFPCDRRRSTCFLMAGLTCLPMAERRLTPKKTGTSFCNADLMKKKYYSPCPRVKFDSPLGEPLKDSFPVLL